MNIPRPCRRLHGRPAWRRAAVAVVLALALCLPATAGAVEVYALLSRDCTTRTGLIVGVDAERVDLLDLAGELTVVPRAEVHRVLVYNTLDNPIAQLNFAGGLGALTREVHLAGEDGPGYLGWPIRFQEDAIIFFDVDGKTHVEDVERVALVRKAQGLSGRRTLAQAVPRTFLPGPNLAECAQSRAGEGPPIYPNRIISDRIKISRFLASYDRGFEELERFRRRSAFYARPFLYDKQTKVALSLSGFPGFRSPELPAALPVYFQWSSGVSYGSQGLVVLGSKPVEWLPNVGPLLAVRTEVKSSFFSASFVGNPLALSVGQDFMVENRFAFRDFFSQFGANDTLVLPQLNHLAMTGLDWGAYSAAVGLYYPIVAIMADGLFRELVSPSPSLAYRVLRVTEDTRFRVTYSRTALGAGGPGSEDIRIVLVQDMREPSVISAQSRAAQATLQRFSLDARFLRAGLDVSLRNALELGVDQVRFQGDYREAFPDRDFELHFVHDVTSLHAFQQFGDFVGLRAYLNYFNRRYEQTADGERRNPDAQDFSLVIAIEFVL